MASIFGRMSFAGEDMAKMAIAVSTADLGPAAIRVSEGFYRVWKMVVKSRPAAASIEFGSRVEEGLVALPAQIDAGLEELVILALKRGLGPLADDNLGFFWGEVIVGHKWLN